MPSVRKSGLPEIIVGNPFANGERATSQQLPKLLAHLCALQISSNAKPRGLTPAKQLRTGLLPTVGKCTQCASSISSVLATQVVGWKVAADNPPSSDIRCGSRSDRPERKVRCNKPFSSCGHSSVDDPLRLEVARYVGSLARKPLRLDFWIVPIRSHARVHLAQEPCLFRNKFGALDEVNATDSNPA